MAKQRRQANETLDASIAAKQDLNRGPFKKLGYDNITLTSFAAGVNDLHGTRARAPLDAVVTRISIAFPTVAAGRKYRIGIYSEVGGLPGVLLTQTAEITTTGTEIYGITTFDLLTPINITKDTNYWFGYHSDTTSTIEIALNGASLGSQKFRSIAYSSAGLPSSFGTPTGNSGGGMCMAGW